MKQQNVSAVRRVAFISAFLTVFGAGSAEAGLGSWTTTGPYGGPSYVVVENPVTPGTLYEASPGGGVFKSTDGGMNWTAADNGLTDLTCLTLAIDPSNPKTLYTAGGQGVFKSVDGAKSWSQVDTTLYSVQHIVIDPQTSSTLYATSLNNAVQKSTDGGQTWVSLYNNGLASFGATSFAIDPKTPSVLYAGTNAGVYKSTDTGASWTLITNGLTDFPYINAIAIDPADTNTLYAASDTAQGVFKSTDGGMTWAASGTGLPQSSDPGALAIDPKTSGIVYAAIGGPYDPNQVYISRNGGTSWTLLATGLPSGFSINIRSIAINPKKPANVYLATDMGIYASANRGTQWTRRIAGLANMVVTAIAVNPKNPTTVYAGTEYNGMYRSLDGGTTWAKINTGLPGGFTGNQYSLSGVSVIILDPTHPKTVYIGTGWNNTASIYKSIDGGTTWHPSAGGVLDTQTTGREFPISSMVIDRSNPSTLFAATNDPGWGVAMSLDSGATWNWVSTGLPTDMAVDKIELAGDAIVAASINPPYSGAYIAPYASGTTSALNWSTACSTSTLGFINSFTGVSVSVAQVTSGLATLGYNSWVGEALTASCTNSASIAGRVAAVAMKAMLTPRPATGGAFDPSLCKPYTTAIVDPKALGNFYASGACGVIAGTNLGTTITHMANGLPPNLAVNAIAIVPTGKKLFAATSGRGVYKYALP